MNKMTKTRKFAVTLVDVGVTGMELRLNLAQCQKLAEIRDRTIVALNMPGKASSYETKELMRVILMELSPFLELFKDFPTPSGVDLWVNEEVNLLDDLQDEE